MILATTRNQDQEPRLTTYSIETREGDERIHAERVNFPWPAR
jgi:hypothetical protein